MTEPAASPVFVARRRRKDAPASEVYDPAADVRAAQAEWARTKKAHDASIQRRHLAVRRAHNQGQLTFADLANLLGVVNSRAQDIARGSNPRRNGKKAKK